MPKGTPCSVDGCDRDSRTRGLCGMHHLRWLRHGDVGTAAPKVYSGRLYTVAERFWAKVDKNGPIPDARPDLGPCWIWTGALANGYGRFSVHGNGRCAHVVAYELAVGSVPTGKELDHLCVNPACVRPGHLEPVTHRENMRRGPTNVAGRNAAKTHCPQGHEYTEANTMRRKNGDRHCRICDSERSRAAYRRRRDVTAA